MKCHTFTRFARILIVNPSLPSQNTYYYKKLFYVINLETDYLQQLVQYSMMNMESLMAAFEKYEDDRKRLEKERLQLAETYNSMFKLDTKPRPKR